MHQPSRNKRGSSAGAIKETPLILTCEHGGNRIPSGYRDLFAPHAELLASHRGWDPGALALARHLSSVLGAPLFYSEISRLLVDLNRSRRGRGVFSNVVRPLSAKQKEELIARYYLPFRDQVAAMITRCIALFGYACHVSVHSFTPVLGDAVRNADIGVLYDPGRENEKVWAGRIADVLRAQNAPFRVRMNYPYRGTADGHTTFLRERFPPAEYRGIELEVNQALLVAGSPSLVRVHETLAKALPGALDVLEPMRPSTTPRAIPASSASIGGHPR